MKDRKSWQGKLFIKMKDFEGFVDSEGYVDLTKEEKIKEKLKVSESNNEENSAVNSNVKSETTDNSLDSIGNFFSFIGNNDNIQTKNTIPSSTSIQDIIDRLIVVENKLIELERKIKNFY